VPGVPYIYLPGGPVWYLPKQAAGLLDQRFMSLLPFRASWCSRGGAKESPELLIRTLAFWPKQFSTNQTSHNAIYGIEFYKCKVEVIKWINSFVGDPDKRVRQDTLGAILTLVQWEVRDALLYNAPKDYKNP
jgi:hypothetical protein